MHPARIKTIKAPVRRRFLSIFSSLLELKEDYTQEDKKNWINP